MAPPRSELPAGYAEFLASLKVRVERERLRVVLAASSAMVLLYWDIGKAILDRQAGEGWGAKVIDRLAKDLGDAYPDMRGFSPRNLKYMRAFAAAWPDHEVVQRVVARLPWRQNIALLERLAARDQRLWYAEPIGVAEWETRLVEALPEGLRGSLPTVEEIEVELGREDADGGGVSSR